MTLEEIKEWYAAKTKRKVFEFDEYDLHICSVVHGFSNDQNKQKKPSKKQIKEAALLMLEHDTFENVIDWVLSQIEKVK